MTSQGRNQLTTARRSTLAVHASVLAAGSRELYVELAVPSHFTGSSSYVSDTVASLFGLMPQVVRWTRANAYVSAITR